MGDTLIGETYIDVEDRWFNPHWQELLKPLPSQPSPAVNNPISKIPNPSKLQTPIETLQFFLRGESNSRASAQVWIDILPEAEARTDPPLQIRMPPPVDLELRIIVWVRTA
jgi:hypothetical protein